MLTADSAGRCLRISSVRNLGVARNFGSLGARVMRFLFRQPVYRLDMTLDLVPEMTFDNLKAHVCAAI